MGGRILYRYILKEMTGPFFIGLAVYSFLFLINLLFQLAGLVIQQGLSAGLTGLLFILSLPKLLSYTFPVALLLGTIIAFGRLSSDSEITAIRAGGIRERRLLLPPLLFAALIAFLMLFFNLWLIPHSRSLSDRIQNRSLEAANLLRLLRPGVFFDRIPDVLVYAQGMDREAGKYKDVLIFQKTKPSVDVITLADSGRTARSPQNGALQFLLESGETLQFDRKHPGRVQRSTFAVQALTVEPSGRDPSKDSQKGLSEYSTSELVERLGGPPQFSDPSLNRVQRYGWLFELHRRVASSLAVLFFVLVGVPLGLVNVRGGKGAGFSLSLIVLLGYWILGSALGDLALAGRWRPEAAAWLPDLALLGVGLWLLRSRRRVAAPGWIRFFLLLFPARKPRAAEDRDRRAIRPRRGFAILDRYLFGKMVRFGILISFSILFLDWLIEARGLSEYVTGQAKLAVLGRYLLEQTPGVLSLLMPFVVLMTVLATFGMLERSNEILAAKASGISLYRIALPALALGLLVCAGTWAMGELLVPHSSRRAQALRDTLKNYASRNVASTMDVWLFAPNRQELFHYNHYDAKKKLFRGFSLYRLSPGSFRLESRFFAKRARFEGKTTLAYERGWLWKDASDRSFEALPRGTLTVGLPRSYFVVPSFKEARYFNSRELQRLIRDLRARGYPSYQQKMDYYRKYSDAAAPLVLLLIGLPFAFLTGRRGSLYGIALALALAIAYYALTAVFNSVGVMQWLDPALAAWTPTVLFGLAGGYLLLNLRS